MIYILRRKVFRQLDEIHGYIAENEYENRADKVIKSIFDTFEKIVVHPLYFPIHSRYKHLNVSTRKTVVHKTFIITFRIYKNHVAILDVFHGKRRPI